MPEEKNLDMRALVVALRHDKGTFYRRLSIPVKLNCHSAAEYENHEINENLDDKSITWNPLKKANFAIITASPAVWLLPLPLTSIVSLYVYSL